LLEQTFYSIATTLMVLGYTAATVWCLTRGYGVTGVLWSQVVFLALALIGLSVRAGKRISPILELPPGTSLKIRSRVTRFASISFLLAVGVNLRNAAVDVLVISSFLGETEVALYGFASGLALMAYQYTPMANVGNILTPLVVREYSQNKNPEKLSFFFQLSTKLNAYSSVPILAALFVLLPNVIADIYNNPSYMPGLNVGRIFVLYMILKLFTRPFVVLYVTLERLELSLYALGFSVLNFLLLLVVVPRFGIIGAACCTCGLEPLFLAYHWVVFRLVLRIPLRMPWVALSKVILNLVPACVLGLWWGTHYKGTFQTLIGFALFFVLYWFCSRVNRIFDDRESALLKRMMGRWSYLL
jgi:O-antigen/teichoic acid export membrane protein